MGCRVSSECGRKLGIVEATSMPEDLVQEFRRITDIFGSGRPDPWGKHPSGDEKGEI